MFQMLLGFEKVYKVLIIEKLQILNHEKNYIFLVVDILFYKTNYAFVNSVEIFSQS